MTLSQFYADPLFGMTLTVGVYAAATSLNRRFRWANPLVLNILVVVAVLVGFGIPYDSYNAGGRIVSFFLGPATVALAVPMVDHARRIGRRMGPVLAAAVVGTAVSMVVSGGLAYLLGGDRTVVLSMIPRGCTTPIAMAVADQIGGSHSWAAIATGVSGLVGVVVGPPLLRLAGVRRDVPFGAAMGTASHAIGTARSLRHSDAAGGVAALAMTVAGVLTAVLGIAIRWWASR